MLHKEFWGLLFLAFVGWIFLSSNPNERIEHFCRPVGWMGNVSTSATAMVVPAQQITVQNWFDKFEYGCRYMTWRLIYQADYNKAMGIAPGQAVPSDAQLNGAPAASAAAASASASASATPEKAESK